VKKLFRSPGVQSALALIYAAYMRLCYATIRWRRENREVVEGVWAAGGPVIYCLWHSRVSLGPSSWPTTGVQAPRVLISLSPDGEFIAKAVQSLGFPAIRGSSSKKSDPDKAKGGAQAFRDGLRWLKGDNMLAITPDGPRGPAEVMQEGAVMFAKTTGAPVILAGLACAPCLRLGTWDRGVVPVPFGRGAMVWAGPFHAARDADTAAVAAEWSRELSAVTRRAEALAGAEA